MSSKKPRKFRGKNKIIQCTTEEKLSEPTMPTATESHPVSLQRERRFAIQLPELSEHSDFLYEVASFIMEQLSRAMYESLLNDYMESELFVIDGDSLIITCATNESLKRGQNLHFFYLVECFLLNLTKKGGKYSIVFFEDMEHLYTGYPDLISLRTQLIFHLESNTDVTVLTFSNFLCKKWEEYINSQGPYFVMVSDEGLNNEQTCFLNLFILHTLGMQVNVVLTAGQESDNLRIFGYRLSAAFAHREYLTKNKEKIKKVNDQLIATFQASGKHDFLPFVEQMKKVQIQVFKQITHLQPHLVNGSDVRILICAISCSMTLKIFTEKQMTPQGDGPFVAVDEVADLCRMVCFSEALLTVLPLSQRVKSRLINANWKTEASIILNVLKQCEAFTLKYLRSQGKQLTGSMKWTYISSLSDDLLLKNIAYYCEKESTDACLETGEAVDQMFRCIWDTTLQISQYEKQLQSYELRTTTTTFLSEDASINVYKGKIQNLGLIPVRSDIIDIYAGDIAKDLAVLSSDNAALASLAQAKPYDELIHWHSRRPLSDDYDRTRYEPIKDAYHLRSYQRFQAFQQFYGKSLGLSISKQIVVKNGSSEENKKNYKPHRQKNETKMKKKDLIIEENLKKTRALEEKKEIERWKTISSSLAEEIRRDIFSGMKKAERFFSSLQTTSLKFQAQFHALEICFALWVKNCKDNKDETKRDKRIVVEIMKLIQTILSDPQDMPQREAQKKVVPFLNHLGFENIACQLLCSQVEKKEESPYSVRYGSSRFQMLYMGPYLKRDERTDPDPRVQNFIPDTWQRELLDVVDKNESAVIVAPTSSGKTYASYYCMEKVLTESNEGVVVYVAPTKALVNQVVATVINQFTKSLPNGVALCGVFTRDYRCDALNSQVLVTVPQCLEILLLSPHRQTWVNRIKYIIFDEVHCLGGEIGAEVWEHILAVARCPFLALSATISNPEYLTEWLQSVKKYWKLQDETKESTRSQKAAKKKGLNEEARKSYQVRLVLHDKRYNDLERYVCSVKNDDINFHHYHPCAALTVSQIQKSGIPKDLALSARECLQLYDAMENAWSKWPREEELDPEYNDNLKDKLSITKRDVANYEEELKRELSDWVKKGLNNQVSEVLQSLGHVKPSTHTNWKLHFPKLVEQLRQLDKLPALFFAFDIKLVENLARELGHNLDKNAEIMQTQKMVKEMHKMEIKGKCIEKTHASSKDEHFVKQAMAVSLKQKFEKLSKEPPEFNYANYGAVDSETLQEMIEKIKTVRNSEEVIALAERGIGYHHGAVDYKARRFVEMLFRMGHIRVVTATSSLALGINMPCKSVVFLKDSSYLDALNYRQMAGRAGRRGLDLEGNVYFFNIPISKVKKLIKSNVPELRGQFPLSISLVLRLMLLAARAEDKEDARAKVLSVLKHSLMSFKHPVKTQMLKMYFVFSLQYLVHEGYLTTECDPLELTGLVTHLHYHEPSNFLFVSFLKKGLFHKLCKPRSEYQRVFPSSLLETLMLVLAHLFGREYILSQNEKYRGPFFQSKVFLEKLPDDFAAVVEEHNRNVALIFGQCILTASKLADMEKEYQLPLSKINFSGKECVNSELVDHLMSCSEGRIGISPFACLSGNTDHDISMKNINSVRMQTIQMPQKYIPFFHLEKTDAYGRALHLNSYALDFFKHGSIKAIVSDNGFNEGDAYYKLRDFSLSIQAISVSIKEMCDDEYDPVSMAFEQLSRRFKEKLALVK